jgi:hypothetical protein
LHIGRARGKKGREEGRDGSMIAFTLGYLATRGSRFDASKITSSNLFSYSVVFIIIRSMWTSCAIGFTASDQAFSNCHDQILWELVHTFFNHSIEDRLCQVIWVKGVRTEKLAKKKGKGRKRIDKST